MRTKLSRLLGVSAFIFLSTVATLACTCVPPSHKPLRQQVVEARNSSKAVFSGKVVEIVEDPKDSLNLMVKLRVERSWKGVGAEEVLIITGRGGGDCGYGFEVGESYLVYASASDGGRLGTNICQRTRSHSDAGGDIKVLGKSKVWRNAKPRPR